MNRRTFLTALATVGGCSAPSSTPRETPADTPTRTTTATTTPTTTRTTTEAATDTPTEEPTDTATETPDPNELITADDPAGTIFGPEFSYENLPPEREKPIRVRVSSPGPRLLTNCRLEVAYYENGEFTDSIEVNLGPLHPTRPGIYTLPDITMAATGGEVTGFGGSFFPGIVGLKNVEVGESVEHAPTTPHGDRVRWSKEVKNTGDTVRSIGAALFCLGEDGTVYAAGERKEQLPSNAGMDVPALAPRFDEPTITATEVITFRPV